MSTLSIGTIKSLTGSGPPVVQNSAGTEVGTFCRAWVNFNVTTGVPTISGSFNVSGIVDNGVGNFTVNFASAFQDTNYAVAAFARKNSIDDANPLIVSANHTYVYTTSAFQLKTVVGSWAFQDGTNVSVAFFR